jgi:hypothetical protein
VLLLQSLWTPVLEKHVAGLATELLQKVFCEVCVQHSSSSNISSSSSTSANSRGARPISVWCNQQQS